MDEWDRTSFIGGSDIAGIMSLSRWETPLSIWAKKTKNDSRKFEMNEAVEFGIALEDFVAKTFAKRTGLKVRRNKKDFKHKKYKYMQAHIDRDIVGGMILECKTCSAYKLNEWEGDEIPDEYLLQFNWYLGILEKEEGYIAVLIGGQKFIYKKVQFSAKLFDKQVAAAKDFWENYVLKEVPPMATADDQDVLSELSPTASDIIEKVEGGELEYTVNDLITDVLEGNAQIKEIKSMQDEAKNKIRQMIGDKLGIETGHYKATWKNQNDTRVDNEKIRDLLDFVNEKLQEIKRKTDQNSVCTIVDDVLPLQFAQCNRTKSIRVLRFKEKKEGE